MRLNNNNNKKTISVGIIIRMMMLYGSEISLLTRSVFVYTQEREREIEHEPMR